ncbi:TPA: ABC transporter ATP-binding protein [Streptococcus suis]|nr:ABC transporter ATP-binding protein [Streptococcus suis]
MKKLHFMLTVICITIVAALNIFFNYHISNIIDSLTAKDSLAFYDSILLIVGVVLLLLAAELVRQISNQRFLNQISYKIQATLVGRILTGRSLLSQSEVSGYVSKINNDIERVTELYYDTFFSLYQGLVSFLIASIALFSLDIQVSLTILLVSTIPVGIPYLVNSYRTKVEEAISLEKVSYQSKLQDLLGNLLLVKNNGLAQQFYKKINQQYQQINAQEDKCAFLTAVVNIGSGFFFYLTTMIILFIGGQKVLTGQMSLGALVAIYSISLELISPVGLIASSISDMTSVRTIRKDLVGNDTVDFAEVSGNPNFSNLRIEDLDYRVDHGSLFNHLHLQFDAGKKYLIQGESGVGKSTLVHLLTQNTKERVSGIYLNDQALSNLSYETVQSYISFVPQKVNLFQDSIWYNITLGRAVDEERVFKWLHRFGLSERFPNKESMMNERFDETTSLSGGQQQRLVIIRVLLLGKPILILDETLSGLDDETFKSVEQALLAEQGQTLLHISHRSMYKERYDEVIRLE